MIFESFLYYTIFWGLCQKGASTFLRSPYFAWVFSCFFVTFINYIDQAIKVVIRFLFHIRYSKRLHKTLREKGFLSP